MPSRMPNGEWLSCKLYKILMCVSLNLQICFCSDGFMETYEGECEDIDECATGSDGCHGTCENKPGSYMCTHNFVLKL